MSKPIDDGGPAFPVPPDGDRPFADQGMSLRMWLAAHAPAEVVEVMFVNTYSGIADFLGLGPDEPCSPTNVLRADVKARLMWADAMIKEAKR